MWRVAGHHGKAAARALYKHQRCSSTTARGMAAIPSLRSITARAELVTQQQQQQQQQQHSQQHHRSLHTSRARRAVASKGDDDDTTSTAVVEPAAAAENAPRQRSGFLGLFNRDNSIAGDSYNRWWVVPSAFLIQTSIGSVYAWSIFNGPLSRELGVVAAASSDWPLSSVMPIVSACAVTLGLCTALLGKWAEREGPRKVASVAAAAWGSGLLLTGLGVGMHQLPLLYLGYGALGGAGWGLGYISPVSTLMKWFPDRRGLATGLALTSFGGGAMIATPLNEGLMKLYFKAPQYLGQATDVQLITEHGKRLAEVAGELKEVIVATAHDVANLPGLQEGVYVVGTGNTGAASTFLTLGVGYFLAMMTGALTIRVPKEGWLPKGWTPPPPDPKSLIATSSVDADTALRTPQFYLFWTAVAGNAIAGFSIIASAKTLMNDCFGAALPHLVTGAFAGSYVAALSAANMFGRLGWATVSDWTGRKNMYYMFALGIPIAISIPSITSMVAAGGSMFPLLLFYGGTVAVVSFYGGLFSVLPAYLADVFGPKNASAIHGRALTAWSAAALCGPPLLGTLRGWSYDSAVRKLAVSVDAERFREAYGAGSDKLQELLDAKTVTIANLMEIAPAGTIDPTPSLYNTTMYTMAGLLTVAALANMAIRPVDPKFHIKEKK